MKSLLVLTLPTTPGLVSTAQIKMLQKMAGVNVQHSGLVSTAQIKMLHKMAGVNVQHSGLVSTAQINMLHKMAGVSVQHTYALWSYALWSCFVKTAQCQRPTLWSCLHTTSLATQKNGSCQCQAYCLVLCALHRSRYTKGADTHVCQTQWSSSFPKRPASTWGSWLKKVSQLGSLVDIVITTGAFQAHWGVQVF